VYAVKISTLENTKMALGVARMNLVNTVFQIHLDVARVVATLGCPRRN
jgi:hypothetical protein